MEHKNLNIAENQQLNIAGVSRCPLLIHYGSDKFIPEKVLPVKNGNHNKPKKDGGLWTSPVDSKWGWRDWNDFELFRNCDEQNSFTVCLKADAKIFVIDSLEDLKNSPLRKGYSKRVLNFELIAQSYDAIWLTVKGQKETHSSYPIDLYGWDCETVLILNPDCCTAMSKENKTSSKQQNGNDFIADVSNSTVLEIPTPEKYQW